MIDEDYSVEIDADVLDRDFDQVDLYAEHTEVEDTPDNTGIQWE